MPRRLYAPPRPSKDPVFEEWTEWMPQRDELPMDEDHYWFAGNMNVVRDAYIRMGIANYKLAMKDFISIRKITVPDFGGRIVTIQSVPQDHKYLSDFAKLAGIPYRGEGIPGLTQKVLLKLLRPERKEISQTLRTKITLKQEAKCAKCGTVCKLEMDHVHKISMGSL